jgi:ATP-dependent protease ClpP protease subunit
MELTKTYTNTVILDGRRYVEVGNLERIYSVGTEIHFTDNINDDTIESLIKETTHVITENIKSGGHRSKDSKLNITFIVDSPGGSVTAVLKFVDFIRMAKEKHPNVEFTSIITGMVASAGTIMCAVADHRYMTKHAFAMIHELATGNVGKYTQLISHADFITTMHNTLVKIYQKVCGKSVEEIEALMMRETWYSADKYLQHGFVDELR